MRSHAVIASASLRATDTCPHYPFAWPLARCGPAPIVVMSIFAFVLLTGIPPLMAQFTTATLGGTITDASGSAVPGAKVTVQNMNTDLTRSASTANDGAYLFPILPVGAYRLIVEKEGFSRYAQEGITLNVSQSATQNVALKLGAVNQQVNVSADAAILPTQTSTVSQLVDQKRIIDLPLNGRQAQSLLFLVPGTYDASSKYCGYNCQGGVYPGAQFAAVNGGGPGNVNYQMDGGDHNDNYLNINLPFPNPDAIQEFSAQSANMSAEYGNSAVVVNVVTKSGTNEYHGDLFEFLRNGDLNARTFFAPTQDTLKRNQFGGTVGGPILKNKLFFFFTYQGTRATSAPSGAVSFVPTAAERTGDFSAVSTQLVDPLTNTPFPNNQIPVGRLSAPALYFLQHIPLPNGPNGQLTYLGPTARTTDNQFMPKIDYITGKNQLSGRYFYTNYTQPSDLAAGKANVLATDGNGNSARVQTISINDTYTQSPALLFSTWFSYDRSIGASLSGAPFGFTDAGINIAVPSGPPAMEEVGVNGYFYIESGHPGVFDRNDWRIREIATWQKGAHEFHFGGEINHLGTPQANTYEQTPDIVFSNALSGSNLADYMLGQVSTYTQDAGVYYNYSGLEGSLFAQDNWRVNQKLTLNLGVRWDPYFPYTDSENRIPCYLPGQKSQRYPNAPAGLVYAGDSGCPSGGTHGITGNFAPRLGFAYRLGQNTVIRGGAGLYYTLPNTDQINNFTSVAPFAPVFTLTDVNFQNPWQSAGIVNPFPAQFGGGAVPASTAAYTLPVTLGGVFPTQYYLPTVATWNLFVQRQLGKDWLFTTGYVANAGYHLSSNAVGRLQINPAIYVPGQSTEANTQSRRINPNFGSALAYPVDLVSRYESLQVDIEKRFSRGFSLRANYTYSKLEDDENFTNPFNNAYNWGIANTNVPNVFHFSAVWETPHLVNGPAGIAVNGWELTGITTWQNGFPFTIASGVDNSFSAVGSDRADFTGASIAQAVLSGQSHAQEILKYFNTSLFARNAVGTFGNSPRNALYGPRLFNQDFAAMKNFNLVEKMRLQFRAEFFNLFNNVNFNNPGTSVGTGSFGKITGVGSPRILQFGLKLMF
ncbi:MAG: TonB-dependent receptor [Bryobacteraceae bacterium]